MIRQHTLTLPKMKVETEKNGFFRFGRVGKRVVVTNDAGQWHTLSPDDFRAFTAGTLSPDHPDHGHLVAKHFIRGPDYVDDLAMRLRTKTAFLGRGPHLHIVVTTLRCNQGCGYCHASRVPMGRTDTDMTIETAKRVADLALQTPNPHVIFEYQGGEPTTNMDVIKFMVEYTRERIEPGRTLTHSLVSNFTSMTKEKADWLIDNGVLVCTSLDGPEDLHNANRALSGANAYEMVIEWMTYFNQRYLDKGLDPRFWHIDALMTTTRQTLERWPEVVDLYIALGIRNIHFRPLNPYGFAQNSWNKFGYTMDEFLAVYAEVLDDIVARAKGGVEIMEGTAATFLAKLITPFDPNYVDIRSPCGAGLGQIAYHYDGTVYPCDEGRMVAAGGDPIFSLGHCDDNELSDVMAHPTIKAMQMASVLDTLPQCHTCWAKPYCGVCPVHTYRTEHDLFGQRPRSPMCQRFMTTLEMLVKRLDEDADGSTAAVFNRWTEVRPQPSETLC